MDNIIKIGIPRVINIDGSLSRLEAEATWEYEGRQICETIYYEVEERWAKYLTTEYSDAFVLAMLEVALETGLDIQFEAPMTEDLKYQMETYLIPVWTRYMRKLKKFCLIGPTTTRKVETVAGVGTGFSAGVDSFYSVLKHIDSTYKTKKVTHLLLTVNGSAQTGLTKEIDEQWFQEEMRQFSELAQELHLELIGVNSNISLLNRYRKLIKGGDAIVTASFVHALRKLFGTYYWASGYEAKYIGFTTEDTPHADLFNTQLLSVEGLRFYYSGCEVNRVEKVAFIADNEVVQKGLTVCGGIKSCGKCVKCSRTMAELYSIGKLDKFVAIFPDVKFYKKNLGRNLGRMLALNHAPFTTDIINSCKNNGCAFPVTSYLWYMLWFKPLYFFKKKLKHNKLAQKLYYEYDFASKLGEVQPPEYIVEAIKSGKQLEK